MNCSACDNPIDSYHNETKDCEFCQKIMHADCCRSAVDPVDDYFCTLAPEVKSGPKRDFCLTCYDLRVHIVRTSIIGSGILKIPNAKRMTSVIEVDQQMKPYYDAIDAWLGESREKLHAKAMTAGLDAVNAAMARKAR